MQVMKLQSYVDSSKNQIIKFNFTKRGQIRKILEVGAIYSKKLKKYKIILNKKFCYKHRDYKMVIKAIRKNYTVSAKKEVKEQKNNNLIISVLVNIIIAILSMLSIFILLSFIVLLRIIEIKLPTFIFNKNYVAIALFIIKLCLNLIKKLLNFKRDLRL